MRIVGLFIRVILMMFGVGLAAVLVLFAWPESAPDPSCTADPKLRVRVGDQLFAVPRDYRPFIYVDSEDGHNLLPSPVCQRPEDAPIEAEILSIHVGEQPRFPENALTRPIWHVNVHIWSRSARPDAVALRDDTAIEMECSEPPVHSASGAYFGRLCRSPYQVYEGVVLQYRFYDGQHPASGWEQLDARVREFVRSIQTNPDLPQLE